MATTKTTKAKTASKAKKPAAKKPAAKKKKPAAKKKKPAAKKKSAKVKKPAKAVKKGKTAKSSKARAKKTSKNADAKISSSISAVTKAQVNLVEHPVLKIKPITNLSSEEQRQVLDNLQALAQAQTTFADKYYVLDNGLVVMIATSKKDIRGIKRYLRR